MSYRKRKRNSLEPRQRCRAGVSFFIYFYFLQDVISILAFGGGMCVYSSLLQKGPQMVFHEHLVSVLNHPREICDFARPMHAGDVL